MTGPPEVLAEARGLVKRFAGFTAVDGVDFDLRRGEAFGFLGPNGAGKSSTMRMIGCVSPPTGGTLRILGMDPVADGPRIRARLGVVPQEDNLDQELTVYENLLIYGRYFGLRRGVIRERAMALLEFMQLAERADDQVDPLSGGLKRRLTIARSLINEPDILLLDEPTTGLDPQARHLLWDRLYRLKHRGVTLIITTHYMDEAEQLCDRLVVMDGGRIVASGSPLSLIARYSTREVLELRFELDEFEQAADKLIGFFQPNGAAAGPRSRQEPADQAGRAGDGSAQDGRAREGSGERVEVLPDRVLLYTGDGEAALAAVQARGLRPMTTLVRRSTLEDVFLQLTGRRLDD